MKEKTSLDKVKEIYKQYSGDSLAITSDGVMFSNDNRSIYTLRAHARGVQDTSKYQDMLDPITTSGKAKGKRRWKISWEPVRLLSKFRSIGIEKISSMTLIPKTEAVDELARTSKKLSENRMKLVRDPNSKAVLPMEDEFSEIETKEDVDMISKMGGIRLPMEMMMKDAIDITNYNSDFHTISKMLAEDIVDVNAMAVHQHTVNGQEIIEYVDVARILVRPSIYPDFRDSDFRGFISNKTASQIILEADFDDENKIKQVENLDKQGSRSSSMNYTGFRENFSNTGAMANNGIEVLTLYYIERVVERFIDGKRKNGVQQWEKVDDDFTLSERAQKAGKKIVEVPKFILKSCKWVVDTDIIYNDNVVDYIVREGSSGNKKIVWPITIYAGHEPSMISRCIEFDDDLQIANYTLRNIYASIPPAPRMIIFSHLIKDHVSIGGVKHPIMEMIQNYQSDGILLLEGNEFNMEPGETSMAPQSPIQFIPSGVSEDLMQLQARMMQSIDFIRQVTGINEVADGTSQNKDMLKSVMEGLSSATNSALSGYVSMYISGFRSMIKYTALKYQAMAINGDLDLGNLPISDNVMKYVKLSKDVVNHDWGIMVDVVSKEAKDMLMYDLQQRKDQIPPDSYFLIWNIIEAGDIKKAQYILSKKIALAQEEAHERQMQVAQATAQANTQAAIATEQAKSQTIQLQTQGKLEEAKFRAGFEMDKAEKDHVRQLELLEKENMLRGQREIETVRENNRNRMNQ